MSNGCEYMQLHDKTAGSYVDTAFIEGAVDFLIPPALRQEPAWQDIVETGYNVMLLHNDISGFARDFAAGDVFNSVYLLHQQHGMSPDEALEHAVALVDARIKDFLQQERTFAERVTHLGLPDGDIERACDIIAKLKVGSQGCLGFYADTNRYTVGQEPGPAHLPPTFQTTTS
ncbi:hypothetical protein OV450_8405 [Actinobacteria bacterium OV450]|nr:hypothetical protein OV450_8405 [Actinobacteria bacterium OV450]